MRNRSINTSICLPACFAAVACFIFTNHVFCQRVKHNTITPLHQKEKQVKINDSTLLSVGSLGGVCKSGNFFLALNTLQYLPSMQDHRPISLPVGEKQGLPVHGDVTYDFFYRSAIDTPFEDNNIQQHNIRANIHLLLAKKLPVSLQVNTRQSNSPWFKNYTDVNLQFNGQVYNNAVKDEMLNRITKQISTQYAETILLRELQVQQKLQEERGRWLQETRQLQDLTESRQIMERAKELVSNEKNTVTDQVEKNEKIDSAKEKFNSITEKIAPVLTRLREQNKQVQVMGLAKDYAGAVIQQYLSKNKDYLQQRVTDSLSHQKEKAAAFIEEYKAKEDQYKKGKEKLEVLTEKYHAAKETIRQKTEEVKSSFVSGSREEINKKIKEYGQDSAKIFKWYRQISSIDHLSVGRSMVNYSELSAKNISVNGLQVVYSNKVSMAFATGAVDYSYREFIVRNYTPVKQYLNLIRVGIGDKEKSNLFLTIYQGKKQANIFTLSNQPAVNKLFGFALEGRFRINDNNYLLAEAAKSSYPVAVVSNTAINNTGSKTFNFSNHSNEAYSIQLFSRFPKTGTRIYSQYKHLGRNFQSFSVFNVNSDITAWQVRVDQYLLRKKLFITAGLRTNDYSNPYLTNTFKTNAVFKTLQATLRLKKWPVLSVGYMPSAQLTSLNNQVIENRFYTLMGTANYLYRIHKIYMHTGLVYTKFYNDAPDTGFIYYNARNWFIYHNIIGNTITYHTAATFSYNTNYRLLTIDQGLSCKLSEKITAGGGIKWNRLNKQESLFGYYGNLQLRMSKLGELDLSFDRGYIPGLTEKLRKNDFGRATYIKTF